jgi:hypothetical protein
MSTVNQMICATVTALVAAGKAGATALAKIHTTWKGQTMNEANYNSTVAERMEEGLSKSGLYGNENSLRKARSITKLAVLAICNGEEPTPTENLEAFAQRIRDSKVLVAKGVLKARKGKGKTGASKRKGVADKGKPASKRARQGAALLLARNNMADAQAIEYMTQNSERLALLRTLYAKLVEADKV